MSKIDSSPNTVVGIAAKVKHPSAITLTKQIVEWLQNEKVYYRLDTEIGTEISAAKDVLLPRDLLSTRCSHIVVLGGDGTLISVSRHPSDRSPVIIGVNLGTLGFLTEITTDEIIPMLKKTLLGQAQLERKFLLRVRLERKNSEIAQYFAINDVVITKQALARIFGLELKVNNTLATVLRGDGVVIATPSGSTAYSLSAGGSIVHPRVDACLITPICPHSLTSRPLVLPGASEISLKVMSEMRAEQDRVYLTIDGQEGTALETADELTVTTSKHSVLFAKSPSKNYFEVLAKKLRWSYQE